MGSLIMALASYLYVKQRGGEWHVRIDDIDPPRALAGAEEAILSALQAHGLHPDQPVEYQSKHMARYEAAVEHLSSQSFYCQCSRRSLREFAVYPGTCRHQTDPKDDAAIRLDVGQGILAYEDLFLGETEVAVESELGAFIIRRRDGLVAYNLATAVDDTKFSLVIRGQDLTPVTPAQILLMQTLDLAVPRYAHLPVLCYADGVKLSKQTHAPALNNQLASQNLRHAFTYLGFEPPDSIHPSELLTWGVANWSLEKVPAQLPPFTPA